MPYPWFSLWIIHPDARACEATRARFEGQPRARVLQARYEELPPHDCFVTAGNAFGLMTAGVDAAVIQRHGVALMTRVQDHIMERYLGEQPVGTAFVLETGDRERPYLCHAPTMRVPGSIAGSDRVYAAAFAAMVAVHRFNVETDGAPIETLVLPALGTGFGAVSFDESARQMAAAYRNYRTPPHRPNWDSIIARERVICYDGERKVVKR